MKWRDVNVLQHVLGLLPMVLALSQVGEVRGASLGYANLTVPPGYSMLTRPVGPPESLVDPAFFVSPPQNGYTIFTVEGTGFRANNYFNGWSDSAMSIRLGEGWFFKNPYGTNLLFTDIGEVNFGTNGLPAGLSICSSVAPISDLFSFPAVDGDVVHVFNNASDSYSTFRFTGTTWSPTKPQIPVGQSFWVEKRAAAGWTQPRPDSTFGTVAVAQPAVVSTVGQLNFFTFHATNSGWGRVLAADGVTPISSGFVGQLHAGTNADPALMMALGTPVGFLSGSGSGYLRAGTVSVPFAIGGQPVQVQLRVWAPADGLTYEQAAASGGLVGASAVLTLTAHATVEAGLPGLPPRDVNSFPNFKVGRAVPLTLNSSGLTALGQLRFEVNGEAGATCVIEASPDLAPGGWQAVHTNVVPFVFTEPIGLIEPVRFYRGRYLR